MKRQPYLIAKSRGQCGRCHQPVTIGSAFRWEGQPPQPVCQRCIENETDRRIYVERELR